MKTSSAQFGDRVRSAQSAETECANSILRAADILVTAVFVLATACAGDSPISGSIAAAIEKGPGTRLVLAEHAPFRWDRACIFGPYTPDDEVEAVTGIQGAAKSAFDIRSNDGINVLMFIADGRVAASVAHLRRRGDFGPEVVGRCYSREQAAFVVRDPPRQSWGNIGPS